MTYVATIWAVLVLVLAVVTSLAIWSRRGSFARGWTVAAFLVSVPVSAGALTFALGWPVPFVAGLIAPAGDWSVLGTKMIVGKGIYVLLDTGDVPRHYVLPWDRKMADKIQELLDQGDANGGMRMKVPNFDFSWERRDPPEIYALPQEKVLPDKPKQEEPQRFDSI